MSARKVAVGLAVCTIEYGEGTAEVPIDVTCLGCWADWEIGLWNAWGKLGPTKTYKMSKHVLESPDSAQWANVRSGIHRTGDGCWRRVTVRTYVGERAAGDSVVVSAHVFRFGGHATPQSAYLVDFAAPTFGYDFARRHGGSRTRMLDWLVDNLTRLRWLKDPDVLIDDDDRSNQYCSNIFKTVYTTHAGFLC